MEIDGHVNCIALWNVDESTAGEFQAQMHPPRYGVAICRQWWRCLHSKECLRRWWILVVLGEFILFYTTLFTIIIRSRMISRRMFGVAKRVACELWLTYS